MAESSTIPITFLVPSSTGEPMLIELPHQPLRMVVVAREAISLLDKSWNVLGVYFLFGRGENDKDYSVYVGKAQRGLRQRVMEHNRTREDDWSRALLIASDTTHGFDSAAVSWLEGRLWTLIQAATAAQVMNGNRPSDESLPPYHREMLEHYVTPIAAVLRALGYAPDTPDQRPTLTRPSITEQNAAQQTPTEPYTTPTPRTGQHKPRHPMMHTETIADLINGGFVAAGTHLHSIPQAYDITAEILDNGTLELNGQRHSSPSSAAKEVRGGATNGWDFWGVLSGNGQLVSLASLRERLQTEGPREQVAPARPVKVSKQTDEDESKEEQIPEILRLVVGEADPSIEEHRHLTIHQLGISDLIRHGALQTGETVTLTSKQQRIEAHITETGIDLGDGQSLSVSAAASRVLGGRSINGWNCWYVLQEDTLVLLATIRATAEANSTNNTR